MQETVRVKAPTYAARSYEEGQVALRPFPFPYKAALAICSDIDGTTTLDRFLTIQEFLNTQRSSSMGPGIGLEIGNSFFPYTDEDSFAYFSSRSDDREVIEAFIKAGYIDCMHSYGDGARSRAEALQALEVLERRGCKLEVWVDHSRAPSNFGKDVTPGFGDVVKSAVYHADATLAFGVRFIWKGRASSIVGHGVPFTMCSFKQIFDPNHACRSGVNIARELAKTALAYAGNRRFAIHRRNQLLRETALQDGQRSYEFKRCNNHWLGLSYGHDCSGLAYVIRPKTLAHLVSTEGYMVIYTHLGVGPKHKPFIPPGTQAALRGLAEAYHSGDLYVTTTSRILNYYLNHRYLQWAYEVDDEGWIRIAIHGVADPVFGPRLSNPEELQGLTFYVPDRYKTKMCLCDRELMRIKRNPADHTGQESVMIPRTFLSYPLPKGSMVKKPVSEPGRYSK